MNIVLANANRPSFGVVTIPLPISRKEYDHSISLLQEMEIGHCLDADCWVKDIQGGIPLLDCLVGQLVNIDEMDYLVKRLESFSDQEMAAFQGMAYAHGYEKPKDLINLTFCCECVTVVDDFRDLKKIGRQHYLNLNGGCVSTYEYEKLNAREVAMNLLNSRGGKITPYGIIYENGAELVQRYDGKAFPEYLYEFSPLQVEVVDGNGSQSLWLDLPMAESQISRMLERGGISEQNLEIRYVESSLPRDLTETLSIPHETIRELNRMCAVIADFRPMDIDKLASAAFLAQPECALQITHLAENLDQFDFVPNARTPEDYGKYMIRESGHFEYDENLDGFYDYAKYGQQRMDAETGEFNRYGYISYHGTLSLDELMMEDPAEAYQEEQDFQLGGIQ